MAILQPVKPGLSAPIVTSIPDEWSKTWFRSFITNYLQNADIRNAVTPSGGGVSVSSTNFTQPATLALSAIPNNTAFGNVSGHTAPPIALTPTQLTTLVNVFSTSASGAVPRSPGGPNNFLNADANWVTVNGVITAPPSALVGLTPVVGTAMTVMTSDSAPALDQNIAPTWTGNHTFLRGIVGGTPIGGTPSDGSVNISGQYLINGVPFLGPPGRKGRDGADGRRGVPGAPGIGTPGSAGAPGPAVPGRRGRDGNDGRRGVPGAGTAGANGAQGVPGINGIPGRMGRDGHDGRRGTPGQPASFTGAAFANPTALVGLSAVNGSAFTAMRSDAAPALSQAISPTWTGNHTFTAASGISVNINSAAGTIGLQVNGNGTNQVVNFNGAASSLVVLIDSTATGGSYLEFTRSGTAFGFVGNSAPLGGTLDNLGLRGQTGIDLITNAGAHIAVNIVTAGNVTVGAPSSGNTLSVLGLASQVAIVGQAGGGTNPSCFFAQGQAATKTQFMVFNESGQGQWIWYAPASSNDLHLFNSTQGADTFAVTGAGNWNINAPTSGSTVTINGASGLTALVLIETAGSALSINGATGGTYGASWSMTNTSVGATNISKSFRLNPTGGLEIINNAFSSVIFTLDDLGHGFFNGGLDINSTGVGVNIFGPAATQLNALVIQQSGQTEWVIYQPASVGDLHMFSTSFAADVAVWGKNGSLSLAAPTTGQTLTTFVGSDLAGILIQGAQNNVSLTLNNTQTGGVANWRVTSASTGSGFGAGNFVIGTGSSQFVTVTSAGNFLVNTPSSGQAITVNGAANAYTVAVGASATTGQSFGLLVAGGTNGSDAAMTIVNQVNTKIFAQCLGNGAFFLGHNGSASVISGTAAGNVSFAAPSSGTAVAITGASGAFAFSVSTPVGGTMLTIADPTTSTASINMVSAASIFNAPVVQIAQNSTTGGAGEALFVIGPGAGTGNAAAFLVFGGSATIGPNSQWFNHAGTTRYVLVDGDGSFVLGTPTGGSKGLGTLNCTGLFVNGVAVTVP